MEKGLKLIFIFNSGTELFCHFESFVQAISLHNERYFIFTHRDQINFMHCLHWCSATGDDEGRCCCWALSEEQWGWKSPRAFIHVLCAVGSLGQRGEDQSRQ